MAIDTTATLAIADVLAAIGVIFLDKARILVAPMIVDVIFISTISDVLSAGN